MAWTIDTLKEYLTEKINNLADKVAANENKNDEALKISAAEIERRLQHLNGEAGRIAKVLEASIPREVHERDIKEITGKLESLALNMKDTVSKEVLAATLKIPGEEIKSLTTSKDINTGKTMQTATIIAFIMSAIAMAIALFK